MKSIQEKILTKESFYKNKKKFKNKKIGLCHGAFDILHLGHVNHFKEAKELCDILIVSITEDKFIKKGPHQPLFNSTERANFLLSIRHVDFVFISNSETGENSIKLFKPNYYIKGIDYINKNKDNNLKKEKLICKKYNVKIIFTGTKKYSSTKIFNNKYKKISLDEEKILKKIKSKYSISGIKKIIDEINKKTFILTGEPIIDEYKFVNVIGTATKSPIVTSDYLFTENHAGGTLAAANMASNFAKKLIYLFPTSNEKTYIKNINLNPNIKIIPFNINFKLPKKTRYITKVRENKLFQNNLIYKFNPKKKDYLKYLKKIDLLKRKYPLMILDFGLGLFEKKNIKNNLNSSNLYLNVQSNSNNYGFNLFSKYKKYSYLSVNLREFELNFNEKIYDLKQINTISKKLTSLPVSITLGNKGSLFINKKRRLIYCPNFFPDAIDTTGCGDAYFIITSILISMGINDELVPFLGNLYAGLHSKNFGNRTFPNKLELEKTIGSILNV